MNVTTYGKTKAAMKGTHHAHALRFGRNGRKRRQVNAALEIKERETRDKGI